MNSLIPVSASLMFNMSTCSQLKNSKWENRSDSSNPDDQYTDSVPESDPGSPPSIYSSGGFKVNATWHADLDNGTEVSREGDEDFWWRHVDESTRFLVPMNHAALAVVGTTRPEYADCAAMQLSRSKIDGSTENFSDIPPGTWLCARTSAGRLSAFEITHIYKSSRLTIEYTTWE